MFANNKRFAVKQGRLVTGNMGGASDRSMAMTRSGGAARMAETASLFGMGAGAGNSSMQVSASGPLSNVYMLTGLVPEQEDLLRRYYRDIYYYDSVAGAAVDILSSFPFSDWSLTGADSSELMQFNESLARMNIRSLMPIISQTYLVDGSFVGSLIFNAKEKVFIDLLIHAIDDCDIRPLPFFSSDPIIRVRNSKYLQEFMMSNEKRHMDLKKMLPADVVQAFSGPAAELDPLTTLYLARHTLPGTQPTSYLKRILPAYLVEKTLYRGTLVEANRRQRAMLHITMGDDNYEPTPQEMADTVNQFQMADLDPLGAIIATRGSVSAQEVRAGGDFWKWTDNIDTFTPLKLRALGISEAFLSADASYANAETGMSVFMENADAYRSFLTYKIFTNKIFPIVAIANGFFKKGKEQSMQSDAIRRYQANNHTDLIIPTMRWHKPLKAKNDDNVMELLNGLAEKGVPIPLRMWMAASKVDLNTLYQDLQEDEEIKTKLAELSGQKPEDISPPEEAENGDESLGDGGGSEQAMARAIASVARRIGDERARDTSRRRPILGRTFDGSGTEIYEETKTGKRKAVLNQKAALDKLNGNIVKAMKVLEDPSAKAAALQRARKSLGGVPALIDEVKAMLGK